MSRNWIPEFKTFKSPRPLQLILGCQDMQGDGLFYLTIGIWYRSFQIRIPFPCDKYQDDPRFNWELKLFRKPIESHTDRK